MTTKNEATKKTGGDLAIIEQQFGLIQSDFESTIGSVEAHLSFAREKQFALQAIRDNTYLAKAARENPESFRKAITNVATIGLTLNPAIQHAALVPRNIKDKGTRVILDPMYRGLIHLATRDGKIRYVFAEVVKEGDIFQYYGPDVRPNHKFDPFEKGRLKKKTIGAYCLAKLPNSEDVLVTAVGLEEIEKIRDKSAMKEKHIWNEWFDEQSKKTVIKRAQKMWPSNAALAQAIQILNIDNEEGVVSRSNGHASNLSAALRNTAQTKGTGRIIEGNAQPVLTEQDKETQKELGADVLALLEELNVRDKYEPLWLKSANVSNIDDMKIHELEACLKLLLGLKSKRGE